MLNTTDAVPGVTVVSGVLPPATTGKLDSSMVYVVCVSFVNRKPWFTFTEAGFGE